MSQVKIALFVNGKAQQVPKDALIVELLEELKLSPKMILVEHNNRALLRSEWDGIKLEHGDRLELIRVVAGG
ncbi:MAG: sulfur carrier protein ThiS [Blastochloris sp.]|jgi:sulfur carrier protein|nr:sulfur carrier protein ThiS [Blastochloris sp.]